MIDHCTFLLCTAAAATDPARPANTSLARREELLLKSLLRKLVLSFHNRVCEFFPFICANTRTPQATNGEENESNDNEQSILHVCFPLQKSFDFFLHDFNVTFCVSGMHKPNNTLLVNDERRRHLGDIIAVGNLLRLIE